MDLPATLVDPSGEERVVNDPRTYNQLRYGYGWRAASGAAPEPAAVVEPADEPADEPAPVVELVAAPQESDGAAPVEAHGSHESARVDLLNAPPEL